MGSLFEQGATRIGARETRQSTLHQADPAAAPGTPEAIWERASALLGLTDADLLASLEERRALAALEAENLPGNPFAGDAGEDLPPRPDYAKQRRYHDAHMRTVSCKVRLGEARRFYLLCLRSGTTRHTALAAYIDRCCIENRLLAGVRRERMVWDDDAGV